MYDIVFISYNEAYAEDNWNLLKSRFPTAKRVDGVKGIHQAHIKAAKKCFTKMIWIVDADAQIVNDFDFSYEVDKYSLDAVHVWRSRNPINGLEYGYGGIKLFPRNLTLKMDVTKTDMTTSISDKFNAMPEVSNVTAFNTDEYSTWRSAFRECVKLTINNDEESRQRLDAWINTRGTEEFTDEAVKGATEGNQFALKNKDNLEQLNKINDFDWLEEYYDKS